MNLYSKTLDELNAIYEQKLDELPTRAPIYTPTDKVPIIDRIRGIDHVLHIYGEDLDALYRPRLRALRERFKGARRCFLIGNGPSLNQTDLSVLDNEVTFAVNGFFMKAPELAWKPTFYLVEDHLVAEDRADWINNFHGPIKLFPAYLGYMFPAGENTIFYNHRPRVSYPDGFDFSLRADEITYTGCTVTFSMMQIAAYLGFREIYLIGVDASYDVPADAEQNRAYGVGVLDMQSDDPNHFDPDYFGKGFRWHDPQVSEMLRAYAEAKRVLEGSGQTIYNSTVGGKLDIFERRNFNVIFPQARSPEDIVDENAARRLRRHPRLLIFDMTPLGDGTATGELKATLFDGWPQDQMLQVARHGSAGLALVRPDGGVSASVEVVEPGDAAAAVDGFEPDVILYRPVPHASSLHEFAMRTIRRHRKHVVSWIMDDWPSDLAVSDPAQWSELGPDLLAILAQSHARLSICQAMSDAYQKRFGVLFSPVANGVNPICWRGTRHHEGAALKLRYAGGLAANMSLASVLRIARVVEKLAQEGREITLEIRTRNCWRSVADEVLSGFEHTRIDWETMPRDAYQQWLREADVLVIAYNFDQESLRYVRYSLANKLPECLASGAVVLCHGPREAATVDYLTDTGAAVVVDEDSDAAVEKALRAVSDSPGKRNLLAHQARSLSFTKHNVFDQRETLRRTLAAAASEACESIHSESYRSEVKSRHTAATHRFIEKLVTADEAVPAKLLLSSFATSLLLDPDATMVQLGATTQLLPALERALADLPEDDAFRIHFDRVRAHLFAGSTGKW